MTFHSESGGAGWSTVGNYASLNGAIRYNYMIFNATGSNSRMCQVYSGTQRDLGDSGRYVPLVP